MGVKNIINKRKKHIFLILIVCLCVGGLCYKYTKKVKAIESEKSVEASLYQFGEKSEYDIDDEQIGSDRGAYGEFKIFGDIKNQTVQDDVTKFVIKSGDIRFSYIYDDKLLKAEVDDWHLDSDSTDEVNGIDIDGDVDNGVIILQTSLDGQKWYTAKVIRNAFEDVPNRTDSFYTAKDIELNNNTFYKIIVAYKIEKREEKAGKFPWQKAKYSVKKYAEVYKFRAELEEASKQVLDEANQYRLGELKRVSTKNGFTGTEKISKDDPHYGWEIGNFFVSGYTEKKIDSNKGDTDDEKNVFLKNVGDNVTLYFKLIQSDLEKCNGDNDIYVIDGEGNDEYFKTSTFNIKKGALIIRKTDYQNVKEKPVIYRDFLAANASPNSNTKVNLFEEGNYEVALDYIVKEKRKGPLGQDFLKADKEHSYRVFFKFSIRNATCTIHPFDINTGGELINKAFTENGFYIDRAENKYIEYTVKKEILNESSDGLVEDTSYNRPDKEGTKYTSPGIYTITAKNIYTGLEVSKKIYVGTDEKMKASAVTGKEIKEINQLIEDGATIDDEGNIHISEKVIEATKSQEETQQITTIKENEYSITTESEEQSSKRNNKTIIKFYPIFAVLFLVVVAGISGFVGYKISQKNNGKNVKKENGNNTVINKGDDE